MNYLLPMEWSDWQTTLLASLFFVLLGCSKKVNNSCQEFSTVCTITLPNDSGIFRVDRPLDITATIPFVAKNRNGESIDIRNYVPQALMLGIAEIVEGPYDTKSIYDTVILKVKRGRLRSETWNNPYSNPQFLFEKGDTGFVIELTIRFPYPGTFEMLTSGAIFDRNSCPSSYQYSLNLKSNNFHFYKEIRKTEFPIHPIAALNPYYIKLIE